MQARTTGPQPTTKARYRNPLAETSKVYPMDLWGNVKIPILSQGGENNTGGWTDVAAEPDIASFSSLAGISETNVSQGNTTFSLESSYLSLNCSKTTIGRPISPGAVIVSHTWDDSHLSAAYEMTRQNGTWHGFNFTRLSPSSSSSDPIKSVTWSIAVDRFVDNVWTNNLTRRPELVSLSSSPAIFREEIGIQVRPTRLLFQTNFLWHPHAPEANVKALCHMEQKYVESRVNCSRTALSARQDCAVTSQRPSTRAHAPESILHFSFARVFCEVSDRLPQRTNSQMPTTKPDLSLRYILDPALENMTSSTIYSDFMRVNDREFSTRLTQILNTYFILSQQFNSIPSGSIVNNAYIESNLSTPVEVSSQIDVYHVLNEWVALCFVSCIILLLCGASSVVFTHLARGPDILGYASTVVRDSKFIDVQELMDRRIQAGAMDSADITIVMKSERVRYGFIDSTAEGGAVLGVGREVETRQIKGLKQN